MEGDKNPKGKEGNNMSRSEIIKRLEELDKAEFFIMMADVWTAQDWKDMDAIHAEQKELKKKLEEMAE